MSLYAYQYCHNPIYREFTDIVRYNGFKPQNVREIPFLPISLFKSREIKTGHWESDLVFYSSGTTAMDKSRHHVRDPQWYLTNASTIWEETFGPLSDYVFLSLLPNYHDNPSSSLLYMIRHFMSEGHLRSESCYLDEHQTLSDRINLYIKNNVKVVLFGVSFALLDYVSIYRHHDADNLIVVETGGMKKFRKEITRTELHQQLQLGFSGAKIVSEYGMTECLSQMYCRHDHVFTANDKMNILIADPTDPGQILPLGHRGRINIIDLANCDTAAFIATDDMGRMTAGGGVEIIGRLDYSDLRGCNYMM